MTSIDSANPVGTLFLVNEWRGKRTSFSRYDRERMVFETYVTARYLGRVTARSEKARVRQLLALPGTAYARRSSTTSRA